jgi:hypothetical protein
MTWNPDRAHLDAELDELGIPITRETRQLLALLATDPHALYTSLSRLSELHVPEDDQTPNVDRLVADYFALHFESSTEPSLLRKAKPVSAQCKRLLAVLLRDLGEPVPLPELLLANGLRSATPRRLRELETEHGSFKMQTYSRHRVQHYVLESAEPDLAACARYWVKANLRESTMPAARRVLGLLSAYIGDFVTRREIDYVLPEAESPGYGLARSASGESAAAIAELRQRGCQLTEGAEGVRLDSLP